MSGVSRKETRIKWSFTGGAQPFVPILGSLDLSCVVLGSLNMGAHLELDVIRQKIQKTQEPIRWNPGEVVRVTTVGMSDRILVHRSKQ